MARSANSMKAAFKEILESSLESHEERIRSIVEETIEDLLMKRAIREGLKSRKISKRRVLSLIRKS